MILYMHSTTPSDLLIDQINDITEYNEKKPKNTMYFFKDKISCLLKHTGKNIEKRIVRSLGTASAPPNPPKATDVIKRNSNMSYLL